MGAASIRFDCKAHSPWEQSQSSLELMKMQGEILMLIA